MHAFLYVHTNFTSTHIHAHARTLSQTLEYTKILEILGTHENYYHADTHKQAIRHTHTHTCTCIMSEHQ